MIGSHFVALAAFGFAYVDQAGVFTESCLLGLLSARIKGFHLLPHPQPLGVLLTFRASLPL